GRMRRKQLDPITGIVLRRQPCSRGHPDRQMPTSGQTRYAAPVVIMFMRDNHGIDIRRCEFETLQTALAVARGKSAVDQQPRVGVFDNQGIAAAAATEAGKTHAEPPAYPDVPSIQSRSLL